MNLPSLPLLASLALAFCTWQPGLAVAGPAATPHEATQAVEQDIVLPVEGPTLPGLAGRPLCVELEQHFSRGGEDTDPQVDKAYHVIVSAIRFRDYELGQIYELDWMPFGARNGAWLDGADRILGPKGEWVALPLYQKGGIYFERVQTLRESLRRNQPAGFLVECAQDHEAETYPAAYELAGWEGPHTARVDIQIADKVYHTLIDLEKHEAAGDKPLRRVEFKPLPSLCAHPKAARQTGAPPHP